MHKLVKDQLNLLMSTAGFDYNKCSSLFSRAKKLKKSEGSLTPAARTLLNAIDAAILDLRIEADKGKIKPEPMGTLLQFPRSYDGYPLKRTNRNGI